MTTFLTILCLWVGVNALHACWVHSRRGLWERRFTRDADGLLPGAGTFSTGSGPVAILLLHGFADTPFVWRRIADRLAARGFTCLALRLPGSAEPLAQAKRQSLARWREAVDQALSGLRATHPAVWVAGHSMGAALAIDAALRNPTEVSGVVLFAPLIKVSRRRSPLLPPHRWFTLARVALALSPTFESCFSADGVAEDDPAFTYRRDRFIPFCVYRGLFELAHANRAQASRLTQPVFAVTAERDSVVDTPAALRWLARCPGPKRIVTRPDIGHVIPLEAGWESLTDDIAGFIRQHTDSRL